MARREWKCLEGLSERLYGRFFIQLGGYGLASAPAEFRGIRRRYVVDGVAREGAALLAEADRLPIASDSVSVVLLPHTLELASDPHAVLREVDRILISGGSLVLTVFNPFSLYGLWRIFTGRKRSPPWSGRFLMASRVQDWLKLLGFSVEELVHVGYRPPLSGASLYEKLSGLESIGARFWPAASGVYVLLAIKREAPRTLLGRPWRSSRRFIPGHVIEPTTRNDSIL
ncbi:MAG: class I SAM-dependent methyltransferase [Gammaproteobacteria bacterium]|nr:class I SAM-dependent methyltransferase [Gammaproteobacteria bacterium]MBU1655657.1 class I SAM-dependent methyltransferase [Gammaproteobacteria bacterium]MBU1960310.1 class I SAM-dependent methyltransferase [Gammaproteobacteria bacterium]